MGRKKCSEEKYALPLLPQALHMLKNSTQTVLQLRGWTFLVLSALLIEALNCLPPLNADLFSYVNKLKHQH